jgi:hypothetical protein
MMLLSRRDYEDIESCHETYYTGFGSGQCKSQDESKEFDI